MITAQVEEKRRSSFSMCRVQCLFALHHHGGSSQLVQCQSALHPTRMAGIEA
jgi:hypothetical protein